MKKYFIFALAVLSASLLTSCNVMKDNDPEHPSTNFPPTPYNTNHIVVLNDATYRIMNLLGGSDNNGFCNNIFYWWSLMSDDCYGSGGLQDKAAKSLHHFTIENLDQYEYVFLLLILVFHVPTP